ncbi:MAG: oligoendopeptidase F family protein, partial [Herpetosiphonaceae bacterium]|nr:oligoendopeptidase F family protein [Herpetosiphonaceae bacterium]
MTQVVPQRSDVALDHTWDASSIFASDAQWQAAIEQVNAQLVEFRKLHGRLHEGPAVLLQALHELDEIIRVIGKVYVYSSMFYEVDTSDPAAKSKHDRAMGLFGQTMGTIAFVEPEMIAIGFPTLREWMQNEPALAIYAENIRDLERRQAHVRSSEVEQVLGLVSDAFDSATSTHGILADADLRFDPARSVEGAEREITQGTINALLNDTDREVRRTAWEHYSDAHLATKNTMANVIATGVKQHAFIAQVRNYGSSLEAALGETNIPVEVFHQLIATCRKNYPIWHRYWRLRRQALGYDQLHVYDIKAPLTEEKLHIAYEQAVEWIVAGMQPLGEEYTAISQRGLTSERWVDIYPNKGKRAGAFSSGWQGTHPFILMNYNNDVFGLSTLAHELGHSMHSYFTWQNQPAVYANYTIFVAEVASNFNQALVRDYLFKHNQDRDFQIALIEEAMSNFHRYFFIMPILAQFELEIHQRVERGEPLNAESLNQLMFELFREGYGDEVVLDSERI